MQLLRLLQSLAKLCAKLQRGFVATMAVSTSVTGGCMVIYWVDIRHSKFTGLAKDTFYILLY